MDQAGGNAPDCRGDTVAENHYTIPANNPFADGAGGNCDEIWATGLRNPWRFSFDALTNDMWIGDVGQNQTEEIDFQPGSSSGGEDYGWRCYEGNDIFRDDDYFRETCGDAAQYVFPVHTYGRDDGCSVTGGVVYRGADYPGLYGQYIFADFCRRELRSLRGDPSALSHTVFEIEGASLSSPAAFGEDHRGEVYVASLGGSIYQIKTNAPAPTATPGNTPMPTNTPTPTNTPEPTPTSGGSAGMPTPAASLTVDQAAGAPGSEFSFSAINLSPTISGTVEVNGTAVGVVRTDADGTALFILTTDDLPIGTYFVRLTVGTDVITSRLLIDDDEPLHEVEEALQAFPVPSTIDAALETLLPLIISPD